MTKRYGAFDVPHFDLAIAARACGKHHVKMLMACVMDLQGIDVMRMYEEHAMTAIYMNSEMSHHGDPGGRDNTESYHPGLVIEQLNKVRI